MDTAIWPWRGRQWAHLVSDTSLDELHEFAVSIGKRRVAFQGDHYDVDQTERERAIAAGASDVHPRDVVRALRNAGLRRPPRTRIEPWTWVVDTEPLSSVGHLEELVVTRLDPAITSAISSVGSALLGAAASTTLSLFTKPGAVAALLAAGDDEQARQLTRIASHAIGELDDGADWWVSGHGPCVVELVLDR